MFRGLLGVLVLVFAAATGSAKQICPITPEPKEFKVAGPEYTFSAEDSAIVIGNNKSEVDEYAAGRLQDMIVKRFGVKLEVASENQADKYANLILLGETTTNSMLADACKAKGIKLDGETPGFDGYIIDSVKIGQKNAVIIGGSNARGVTYGQASFFQMLVKSGDGLRFKGVSIRDWPTLKWRGRNCAKQVDAAAYDSYVQARINFVDTLYPMVGIHDPNFTIDHPRVIKNLAQAHKRGLYVYAVVNCAVEPALFDKVINAYDELLAMGVDGMWISFDDAGEGIDATVLTQRILKLAKERGLSYHDVVMTPPAGSYHNIETQWNKTMAGNDGFDEMTWFFTRTPCKCDVEAARQIGLKRTLPAWWHNWPRAAGGILNGPYGVSLYDKTPYFEVQPLETGWHMPSYRELSDAGANTDMVVICAAGAEEYVMPVLGIWAWEPQRHDFNKTREAIYKFVFGPGQIEAAKKFDDDYGKLKLLFTKLRYKSKSPAMWPPKLIDPKTRPECVELVSNMERALCKLKGNAAKESMISAARLDVVYFEPMNDAVVYGKKLCGIEYPEYTFKNFSDEMKKLTIRNKKQAQIKLEQAREQVNKQLDFIKAELGNLKYVDEYAAYWQELTSGVEYYEKMIERGKKKKIAERERKEQMARAFPTVVRGDYKETLAKLNEAPKAKVLAQLQPADIAENVPTWQGEGWAAGLYTQGGVQAYAIAFDGTKTCNKGDYIQVTARLVVPKFKGKLQLQIFTAHNTKGDMKAAIGARSSVLALGNRWAWLQDSTNSLAGNEWLTLEAFASDDGPIKAGEGIDIMLHVTNTKTVNNFGSVFFVGPIRLIEVED